MLHSCTSTWTVLGRRPRWRQIPRPLSLPRCSPVPRHPSKQSRSIINLINYFISKRYGYKSKFSGCLHTIPASLQITPASLQTTPPSQTSTTSASGAFGSWRPPSVWTHEKSTGGFTPAGSFPLNKHGGRLVSPSKTRRKSDKVETLANQTTLLYCNYNYLCILLISSHILYCYIHILELSK